MGENLGVGKQAREGDAKVELNAGPNDFCALQAWPCCKDVQVWVYGEVRGGLSSLLLRADTCGSL